MSAPVPPVAKRVEKVQQWHGRAFVDPYYWLREKDTPPVRDYLEAENAYTEASAAGLKPFAETLYQEMLGRIRQTDLEVPVKDRGYYYYSRTVEGQQYPIRCRKAAAADGSLDEKASEVVLLDQNQLARGLTYLAVGSFRISEDEQKLLYTTDVSGFRVYRLYVKDLKTGTVTGPLADRVVGAVWAADNETIFYATEHPVTKRTDTLWRLRLGRSPVKVYEETDALFTLQVSLTKDRRYVVRFCGATDTWDNWILPADQPEGEFRQVLPRTKGHKYAIEHRDGVLYLRTNRDAKNFRLVQAPVATPSPEHWKELLPHRETVLLEEVEPFRDFITVQEKEAGLVRLRVQASGRAEWKDIGFPEPVYAAHLGANPDFTSRRLRYDYQSFITPRSVYEFDVAGGTSTLLKREEVLGNYDPAAYESRRLWATARDGTKVPISLVARKGHPLDGSRPLWLYGYGSYGYGMSATFDHRRLSILDRGVAYAIAHIRGGDEMGERWHDDGMLMKKRNTFHDFVDCADDLVREQWTTPEKLMIEGGSAGGLLMGAVVNERPELFRAVHLAVPFVDVMNTMMDDTLPLTIQEYLEWGNPNEKAAFDYMLSYSPYDNLVRRDYPAMLVTTSYNDSQVMYWEPAKYVAKLRTLKTDVRPLLLKTKMEPAGHGGASGRYDALRDRALEVAWMLEQVGISK